MRKARESSPAATITACRMPAWPEATKKSSKNRVCTPYSRGKAISSSVLPGLASTPPGYGSREAMKTCAYSSRTNGCGLTACRARHPATSSAVADAADDVPGVLVGAQRSEFRCRAHGRPPVTSAMNGQLFPTYLRAASEFEKHRDRAVVHQLDLHVRAELSGLHLGAQPSQRCGELGHQRLGHRPERPHSTKAGGPWRCRRTG